MLITEELFLLLRRDDGKYEDFSAENAYGLTAAVVSDLILAERLSVDEDEDPRLRVLSDAPTGRPILDAALERLREREGRALSDLVTDAKLNPERETVRSLVDAGVVGVEEKRALGLVPARYPLLDPTAEDAVRARLRDVLHGGTPTPADSVLLSVLQGLDLTKRVLEDERDGLSAKELDARITEVGQQVAAGAAVREAVKAVNASLLAAVFIPVIIHGGGSSS